jgi:hypothetical protein
MTPSKCYGSGSANPCNNFNFHISTIRAVAGAVFRKGPAPNIVLALSERERWGAKPA